MRILWTVIAFLLAGCAVTDPHPVYWTTTSTSEGRRTLVVGVEPLAANQGSVETMARELAFALAQRGRSVLPMSTFIERTEAAGRSVPDDLRVRLQQGVLDQDVCAWLQAEHIHSVIFLEVQLFDQVWGTLGKRTRVGLLARGRELANGEDVWRAYVTPDVEDEPGRASQLATDAALGALASVISGESRGVRGIPQIPDQTLKIPDVRVRW